jgi:hypothetical protein
MREQQIVYDAVIVGQIDRRSDRHEDSTLPLNVSTESSSASGTIGRQAECVYRCSTAA